MGCEKKQKRRFFTKRKKKKKRKRKVSNNPQTTQATQATNLCILSLCNLDESSRSGMNHIQCFHDSGAIIGDHDCACCIIANEFIHSSWSECRPDHVDDRLACIDVARDHTGTLLGSGTIAKNNNARLKVLTHFLKKLGMREREGKR